MCVLLVIQASIRLQILNIVKLILITVSLIILPKFHSLILLIKLKMNIGAQLVK